MKSPQPVTTLLVTLHGARSTNIGMDALVTFCKQALPDLKTYIVNYGEIDILYAINDPPVRQLIYRSVALDFRGLADKLSGYPNTDTRIVVVAQSLGTLALYEYFRRVRNPVVLIQQVILVGSILPQMVEWDQFIEPPSLIASPPINFARPFDLIARQAYRISNERTISGTRGFSPVGSHTAINAFKRDGHGSFNPDDFADIRDIVAAAGWTPEYPTEALFNRTLTPGEKIRLNTYRAARLC